MEVKSQTGIRARLTRWFFLVSILPLLAVSAIIEFQRAEDVKAAAISKLSVIRDLKVRELGNWFAERKGDIQNLTEEPNLRSFEFLNLRQEHTPENIASLGHIRETLGNVLAFYTSYSKIFLLDPFGKVIVSTTEEDEGLDKSRFPYFLDTVRGRKTRVGDIHFSEEVKKETMTFSRPVFCSTHGGRHLLGVLVLIIDLDRSLYPLLLERTGLGRTGETLIVNRTGVALNELRWHKDAPLKLKINAEPAVNAAAGKTGVVEAVDYRGEPVLAAFTNIPETGWGFVSKQDQSEVYRRIYSQLRTLFAILVFSLAGSYALAVILAKSLSKPILDITDTVKQIEEGDLSVQISENMDGEFKVLSDVFNAMVKSLASERSVEADIREINEILVAETDIKHLARKVLEKLLDSTASAFGAFYLINKDTRRFELVFSLGFDPEELKSAGPEIISGAFNTACETGKIVYLDEIPKDIFFTVNTVAGRAVPKSMLTVPVMVKGTPGAVISLGSLKRYSKETREFFNRVHSTMNSGVSNILSGEEIQRLVRTLDSSNAELEEQAAELKASTDELQQQNRALASQRREVEEASKLKSEFLSNMSHELRTPLNSVLALSGVLRMQAGERLDSEEIGYLEIIERNGRRLLNLINDILDLSKIEAGRMEVMEEVFQPKVMIESIVETIEPLCREKGLELEVAVSGDLPRIKSDERKLFHIVQNLLSNAVKFTEEGKITVSARSDGKNFFMTVSDTGIGIKEEDLGNIFKEFKQVDGSTARQYEGTGLGLAIARKAALLLGGDLSVTSEYGKGTTFELKLPLTWDALKPVPEPPEQAGENRTLTVIMVDDDLEFLKTVSGYLSEEGFNVITASSGKVALELAERYRAMAIVLDILMPETDGWEVLEKLKANPDTSTIPVIIVSVTEERETGFALGAVGHLTKPVTKAELVTEIRRQCFEPLSVMVADDDEFERSSMVKAIEDESIKTVGVSGGAECIRLVKELTPDLLVLDLMMPDMDGFEVLGKLRADPRTRGLPVIVVTAKELDREERERLSLHLVTYIEKNQMTHEKLLEDVKKHLGRIAGKALPVPPARSGTGEKILIVEDNETSVIQIKSILEREGYQVSVACGGREAVEFVTHTIPDGIIMDLMMPEMDGFEVLDKMRGFEATRFTPVLVLTAKDLTPDDLSRLRENNIFQLVQKGDVKREDLVGKIRKMLGRGGGIKKLTKDPVPEEKERPLKKIRVTVKPGEKPDILVIEDNPDNMQTVKAILKKLYNITGAFDGETGLKLALKNSPSLILLDISLPGMDGFHVIKKLKDNEKTVKIPVIALTAHAMKGDRERILSAGFDDIISKPIFPEKMLEKMSGIFIG